MDVKKQLCDLSPSKMSLNEPHIPDQKESRKRQRGGRQHEKCKRARNLGKSYFSNRGKGRSVSPRRIGPDCNCRKNCFINVQLEEREYIFETFNALGDFNSQNAYLFDLIHIKDTARKKVGPSRRTFSVLYHVPLFESKIQVCKTAFLNIHGLQKNRGRVENLVAKKGKDSSAPPVDKRGQHNHHNKKYSTDDLTTIRSFIQSLPKYESYNNSYKNTYKMFMSLEYSISHCFKEYTAFCNKLSTDPVSYDKFKKIFTQEFYYFKHNMCKDCDMLPADLQQAEKDKNKEKVKEISLNIQGHNLKANIRRLYIRDAPKDKSALVLTFGLEQALPIPKLSVSAEFHKRRCFCYNLSIHDCSSDIGYFYYWDEATGSCGIDEISSCILKYFNQQDIHIEKLIVISNNVISRNENWDMLSLWLKLLANERVKTVEHIFPFAGHTMLATDKDFQRIQHYVRDNVKYVYCPDDWENILKKAEKKTKFNIYRMQQNDFFKISTLKKFFSVPNITLPNVKLTIEYSTAHSVNYNDAYFGPGRNTCIRNAGQCLTATEFLKQFSTDLPLLYSQPRPINKEKLDEVLSLLKYIPSKKRRYYRTLLADDISI